MQTVQQNAAAQLARMEQALTRATAWMNRATAELDSITGTPMASSAHLTAEQKDLCERVLFELVGNPIAFAPLATKDWIAAVPSATLIANATKLAGAAPSASFIEQFGQFCRSLDLGVTPGAQVKRRGRKYRAMLFPEFPLVVTALASHLGVPESEVTSHTDWLYPDQWPVSRPTSGSQDT